MHARTRERDDSPEVVVARRRPGGAAGRRPRRLGGRRLRLRRGGHGGVLGDGAQRRLPRRGGPR